MKSHARFEVTGRRPDGGLQDDNNQLLFTRAQTAVLLGNCSLATIRRLEEKGSLKRVRLTQCPTGRVYFTRKNVFEVIEKAGEVDESAGALVQQGEQQQGEQQQGEQQQGEQQQGEQQQGEQQQGEQQQGEHLPAVTSNRVQRIVDGED